jgi:hypothetical protein
MCRRKQTHVYYLVKKDRPFSDFGDLLELEFLNGAFDDCADVVKGQYQKYRSERFIREVLESIAVVVRHDVVLSLLKKITFIGMTPLVPAPNYEPCCPQRTSKVCFCR